MFFLQHFNIFSVMGNIYIIIIFLLIHFTSVSAKSNNTFGDCEKIAERFSSHETVNCSNLHITACPGNVSLNECKFEHKLLVTCSNSTPVRINIQSNGLPRFCSNLTSSYRFKEQNINFTVNFNPDVSVNTLQYNPMTEKDLDTIVCNTNSTKSVPNSANFILDSSSINVDQIAGISIDGVPIFNALNTGNEDIFYSKTNISTKLVDECLGYNATDGTYRYRIGSSCPLDPPNFITTTCNNIPACNASIANYSISMFNDTKTLTVIGIAKDGHLIYGPYTSNGILVTNGFDICNGMFFDSIGNYGYFVTNTFPYIIGCFGPGNYPKDLLPNCTTNPPTNYKKSIYAEQFTTSISDRLIITFKFVFLSTTVIIMTKLF
jgi:hypothetical protein